MTDASATLDRFGISTATLAGPLSEKLRAARAAGFTSVSLAARDLVAHPDGVDAAAAMIRRSGLRASARSSRRAIAEGLPPHLRDYKLEVTKSLLVTRGARRSRGCCSSGSSVVAQRERRHPAHRRATCRC